MKVGANSTLENVIATVEGQPYSLKITLIISHDLISAEMTSHALRLKRLLVTL